MAKGNLFQGMARGKVGDVVFYRMNGVQMSRVRNRAPKNPRSVEQLYQRAIIASVMKLYSAGKEIFDHSFQGYTVGEGCMRRFNSLNARILRSQVESDVNTVVDVTKQIGRVVGPKSLSFTPIIGAMISEGTLEQNLFYLKHYDDAVLPGTPGYNPNITGGNYWLLNASTTDYDENTTVADLLKKYAVYAGDIFTFIFNNINTNDVVFQMLAAKMNYSTVYKTYFEWMRLIVKSDIDTALKVSEAKFSDIFDIEANAPNMTFNAADKFTSAITFKLPSGIKIATTGCIRSRLDMDLRSTSYMYTAETDLYGIVPAYMIEAWQMDVQKIGVSELILEGGEEALAATQNLMNLDNTPIIEAMVDESPVRRTTRHKGTRNEKTGD